MSSDIVLNEQELVTEQLFRRTFTAWANRDLETALSGVSNDVVHALNVDGDIAPFAASAVGKPAFRKKLQLVLDTFEFGAFVTDQLFICGPVARARMKLIYTHKTTGERLKTNFRFVITQRDGLMMRIEEYHDAPYVEAFARLIATHR